MNRSIKTFVMTFATLMAVSSCNPSTPNWNEKEQNLMKENLYGEVLPYISDCEVSLDENTIIINNTPPANSKAFDAFSITQIPFFYSILPVNLNDIVLTLPVTLSYVTSF